MSQAALSDTRKRARLRARFQRTRLVRLALNGVESVVIASPLSMYLRQGGDSGFGADAYPGHMCAWAEAATDTRMS